MSNENDNTTDNNLRTAKLIMVTANNNNKYYEMQENGDGTFTVSYGRVGGRATTRSYSMREWDQKYREKTRKGYADQTHLFAESKEEIKLADIDDKGVEKLINLLTKYAKKSIGDNYNVTADQVTRKQVDEAQEILDKIVGMVEKKSKDIKAKLKLEDLNRNLLNLYQIIPRKMSNVNDHLFTGATTQDDVEAMEKKMAEEQATLDVMRGQVDINEKTKVAAEEENANEINLLEAMGLEMATVTDDAVISKIKDLMQDEAHKFHKAFEVTNIKTQQWYDDFKKTAKDQKTELFWHGSRNENWMSILENGLVLRPANAVITGKMFGYGLYFADKFRKSLNYTSLRGSYWTGGTAKDGFLALYEVHVGNQYHLKKHQSWCYELSEKNLKKKGDYDSLFAEGGADLRNNEYIIYNHSQCTVKYLVQVK
ncbi:WGR domain-containing protein [uncultured Microscilla sp.]|uniref:WGR domain-containing protein n=1 Tax=uncultured Microscilla sp. TaxID=432653 RepID=UPI0026139282|nr:WGR domain-containing protein [uncultured Microscilla sp.]